MNSTEKEKPNNHIPDSDIISAFGSSAVPVLLEGGQGQSYLVDKMVLKPVDDERMATWSADLFSSISEDHFRVARPVPTRAGDWTYRGWQAFNYIPGKEVKGKVKEKISVSRAFHSALSQFPKPNFIDSMDNPWVRADRMIWGDQLLEYGSRLQPILNELQVLLKPLVLPNQLIHGDMTGNILFDDLLSPAIIDISPYWRPAEYATAIIIVDSLVWDNAPDSVLNEVEDISQMNQLLIRAAMWRIKTTEEFVKEYGRGSLDDVDYYSHLVNLLKKRNL